MVSGNNADIRKAQLEDLDAIKSLADANSTSLGFVLRPALATGIDKGWVLVAEVPEEGVVGFVHYRHRKDDRTTLYEICVHESHRNRGIGWALIQRLVEETVASGKAGIHLKAPADLAANSFYRTLGFTLNGVEPGKRRLLNLWKLQCDIGDSSP